MSFKFTSIVSGYRVYKDTWEVKIGSGESPFYLSQITVKIVMPLWSFNCFKAAITGSLAAVVVAEGSASDNGPSEF